MGIFPQFEEDEKADSEIIDKCTKCYVKGLPCADTQVGGAEDGGTFVYNKDEDNLFCTRTKCKKSSTSWILSP